jgi:tetrapyrrole methylase family protein/MazG family protein
MPDAPKPPLDALVDLMATLRSPGGCPWDRKQTPLSLKTFVLEEAYEVAAAIDGGDPAELRDELGDLLFQVVFQAQIAHEGGHFDLNDVVRGITDKMIRRHPHVFGDGRADTAEAVLDQWEQRKKKDEGRGVFDGLPAALPALLKSYRVQEKAARLGFDWPDVAGPIAKIREETAELEAAIANGVPAEVEHELGDLLFSLVNVARALKLNPEFALDRTTDRFVRRFQAMERLADERGLSFGDLTLAQMDALWDEVKAGEA